MNLKYVSVLVVLLVGCSGQGSSPADAGADSFFVDVATLDVAWPDAGATDAGPDTPIIVDTGPDAAIVDAGPDAPTCDCPTDTECTSYTCAPDGTCLSEHAPFGTLCGELTGGDGVEPSTMWPEGICNVGTCLPRSCGDGFVEPGPDVLGTPAPPAESCDDGNTLGAPESPVDVCSATCSPLTTPVFGNPIDPDEPAAVPSRIHIRTGQPAIGIDDGGRVLFVWQELDGDVVRLAMQRRDSSGRAIDETPQEISTSVRDSAISVLGLSSGWAIAFTRQDMGVVIARVTEDGSVSSFVRASTESKPFEERDIRLARTAVEGGPGATLQEAVVAVWDQADSIFARRFLVRPGSLSAADSESTTVLRAGSSRRPFITDLTVAASGTHWLVAWRQARGALGNLEPAVMVRRFDGGARGDVTPLDDAPFMVHSFSAEETDRYGRGQHPTVAALPITTGHPEGGFAIAWVGEAYTFEGSITGSGVPRDFTGRHVYGRHLPPGPHEDAPLPLVLAFAEPGSSRPDGTPSLPFACVMAPIPSGYSLSPPADSASHPAQGYGDFLIGCEYTRTPPVFITWSLRPGGASTPSVPEEVELFRHRIRTYEGGLNFVPTAPTPGTRGIWMTALTDSPPTDPLVAINQMVAFLLPITSHALTPEMLSRWRLTTTRRLHATRQLPLSADLTTPFTPSAPSTQETP